MAIHRGIQSAIFYYLSCAPCAEARYRKKRRQEAAQTRAERELLQEEHPNSYRHPSPSSTNPYWQTEIAMGPTLVSRGKRKTNTADSQRALKAGRLSSNASGEPSMVDLPSSSDRNGSLRNFRSYQREDEELWGSTTNLDGSIYANSLPRPQRARTKDSSDYRTYRNPPINDLHPATFTKVYSREDVMWMMQPPPVADVMSGKQRPPRSRSDSGGSCLSPTSSTMSRQVSNRPMATPMSRESSSRTSHRPFGQRSPTTSERDFAISPVLAPQTDIPRRPSPVQNLNDSEDSTHTVIRRHSLAPEPIRRPVANRVASRPQLSTIASDSSIPGDVQALPNKTIERPKENSAPDATQSSDESSVFVDPYRRRSAILLGEEPLQLMHDVGSKGVRDKVFRTATDITDAAHRVPGHKHEESEDAMVVRPELFDSWYTPDFELPKWIHEHTKREVRERWSMDF